MPTYGRSGSPNSVTTNLDALFTLSLANMRKELVDNIAASNALFFKLKNSDQYESADGGTYITENLLYELGTAQWYSGYEELATTTTDGVTQAQFDWAQLAAPVSYNNKEKKQNKHKIKDLVKTKIQQAELGIQEAFARGLMWGSQNSAGTGDLKTAATGPNGASAIEPIFSLIDYTPTTSRTVGGLNQSTYSWWRNKTKTSAATTFEDFLFELENLFNTCALGTGGSPNLGFTDQITFELIKRAQYKRYTADSPKDETMPFENLKFRGCTIVMDDKVPNVSAGTIDAGSTGKGSLVLLNTKYLKIRYEEETDFVMGEFQKPVNQDARVAHMLWMGATTINNRRKQGVMGNIARTLA